MGNAYKKSCYYIFGPKIQKLKVNDKVVVFAQRELAILNQKKKRDERRHGFVDSLPWYKKSHQTNVILVLPKRDLSVNFSMKKKVSLQWKRLNFIPTSKN